MASSAKPIQAAPARLADAIAVTPPSQEALIEGVIAGQPWAHAAMYDALLPVVSRTLCKLLRDAADIEDLIQTTFERIVTALFRQRTAILSLEAFAGAIASRVAIDALRARIRDRRLFQHGPPNIDEDWAPSADRQVQARQELHALQGVLGRMKPEQAQVLILCDVLGHDQSEAAALLGESVGTTQRRLSRARKELLRRATRNIKKERQP